MATVSNHLHQLKSHRYGKDEIAQMAQRLNDISFGMGFGRANDPDTLLKLSLWIKNQFGDISMQEVALAFDLVTSKRIGEKIKHYNSFSKQYIGEVLYAFKTFRNRQIQLYNEEKKAKEIAESSSVAATGEEMYKVIEKTALETGKIMKMADWSAAFTYAWKKKLIHRMNKKERTAYKQGVIESMDTEFRAGFISEVIKEEESLQAECQKRILQAHFQKLIDESKSKTNK